MLFILYIAYVKLTKEQIEIAEKEHTFMLIFEPDSRRYSKTLWNLYKINVWITYKDGMFYKADEKGWV